MIGAVASELRDLDLDFLVRARDERRWIAESEMLSQPVTVESTLESAFGHTHPSRPPIKLRIAQTNIRDLNAGLLP
jgi:hypothetical protein